MLVDYGGPNVAKEMHVGHLRASIIGEAIKRLYRFRGDEVLGDAHFGDWGFQMGLLISAVLDADPTLAELMAPLRGRPGERHPRGRCWPGCSATVSLDDLDRLYPAAAERGEDRRRPIASAPAGRRPSCRPAGPATGCSGRTSPTSPARRWSATSTRWASISTSGRARATSTT